LNLRISGGPGAIRTGRFFQSVGSFRPAPARNQGRNAAPLVSSPLALSRYNLEPQRGFEPLTCRLQIDCASFAPQGHPTLSTAPALLYSRNGPANVGPFQHRVTSANYSQPGAAASIETRCTKSGIRTNGSVVAEGDPAAECRLRAQGHSIVGKSPRPSGRSRNPGPNLGLAESGGDRYRHRPLGPGCDRDDERGGGFNN
jgi:hypothetical protein